jgi:hypothetical protein
MSNTTPNFPQYRQSTSCFGTPKPAVTTVQNSYNPVIAASSGPSTQAVQLHVPNYGASVRIPTKPSIWR